MAKTEAESRSERIAKLAEDAVAILLELRLLVGEESDEPTPPPQVLEIVRAKLRRKECLQCGATYKSSGGKGLCAACYAATKHQLDRRRSVTVGELIVRGLYKPRSLTTVVEKRKATALDALLAEKADKASSPPGLPPAEALAAGIADIARKGRPRPRAGK